MSTARLNNLDLLAPPVAKTIQRRSLVIGVVFALLSLVGAWLAPPAQFFHSYLLGFMAWLGLTVGSMAILMLQYMSGGAWGFVIRRILEAASRTLPLMFVLFLPLVFGTRYLYIWAMPDKVAENKHLLELTHSYLTVPAFAGRGVIYFGIWGTLIYFLSRWSHEQDSPPVREFASRFKRLSAAGLILYCFTMSFAVIDWVMALDAGWISTIYGLIFVAGQALLTVCFVVAVEAILSRYTPVSQFLKPDHLKDHGNFMLTFIMLWAYFSFSQLLIIWSGNLPEEIAWYTRRFSGGWQYVGFALAAFHFAAPFALLLSRERKRHAHRLARIAVWVILMRYVDLFWFIEPTNHTQFFVHWLDVAIPLGMGGLWLAYFFHNLNGWPLLPVFDPHTPAILEAHHE